jgi:DNA-binding MarR family transcriptional regulator
VSSSSSRTRVRPVSKRLNKSSAITRKPGPAKPRVRKKKAGTAEERIFGLPVSATRMELLDEGGATDHRFRQLLHDFSTLGASLELARAHLASLIGLTSPQYNILMILANHQNAGGIRVSDVAKSLHVTTAFVTGEAGRLEQSGLIHKLPNPKDGRGVLLRLTPASEALVQRVGLARQRVNDHLFGSLTAREFRELSRTLAKMINDFTYTMSLLKHGITDEKQSL